VVLNACPVKRGDKEAPAVAQSRAWLDRNGIPVWSGQISQRAGFVVSLAAGDSAAHGAAESLAGVEMTRLWSAIERSVAAINGAYADAATMHGRAA
jgi:chromosome partitioning protein